MRWRPILRICHAGRGTSVSARAGGFLSERHFRVQADASNEAVGTNHVHRPSAPYPALMSKVPQKRERDDDFGRGKEEKGDL
jgi:hypothetical protein